LLDGHDSNKDVSSLSAGQGWPSVPVAKTRTRTFEIRAPPWMARCRDGEKGPSPWMARALAA